MAYKTRAQFVADDIRHRILSGEFPGGSQLRQDALAADYDVSRIPVREALLTLEAEGLVEFYPHRGAFTTELSVTKIRELFDLRVLLESHLLRQAIPRMTESALHKAEQILLEYDAALDSGSQVDNWSDYNFAFHEALYSPADLPEAMNLVSQLNTKSDRYIRMQLLYTREIEKAEREHHDLLELSRQGNADAACQLLERHILEACEGIAAVLEGRVQASQTPDTARL
ncbi:GntR family transcriptional regulator [Halomonas eurihalina]|uniref:GntR family transcriptional regulator n=1 Tax=Halomonas eurihalina TaxID=42566 RepID=A0A5D9D7V6_HALER|nr:GntR family transcriptional regulator [Halomonas eurihalina]MDR5860016.1 GntR family transcriptional regulator [Halomonas eurihalina]TZG39807.1 GntR family transcriptional regulator [Halomonas eurihalina]